jgi:hypothetical protein
VPEVSAEEKQAEEEEADEEADEDQETLAAATAALRAPGPRVGFGSQP